MWIGELFLLHSGLNLERGHLGIGASVGLGMRDGVRGLDGVRADVRLRFQLGRGLRLSVFAG